MMAKKSQKRPLPCEKDQAGCIWGLISIFDIRYGRSSRRLLSHRRRGSGNDVVSSGAGFLGTNLKMLTNSNEKSQKKNQNSEGSEMSTADVVKTSVKELIEEEMFSEQGLKNYTNSAEVEVEQFDSKCSGQLRNIHNRTNKTRMKSCGTQDTLDLDTARNLGPENTSHQVSEMKSSNDLDLEVLMKELCQIHQKNTSSVKCDWHDDLAEENLCAAIKVFINGKHLTEDGQTHNSEELMNALRTLSSNKELFLKLVKDPNSLLVKHVEGEENARLEGDEKTNSLVGPDPLEEELSKHRSFFGRKSKSRESNHLKGNDKSQLSDRIVILKPRPAGLRNANTSQFSFTEIKRKLKHAMGKERAGIARNGIARKFPYEDKKHLGIREKRVGEENGGWDSPNRNHFYTERFAIKRGDKNSKLRDSESSLVNETSGYPKQEVYNIYIEAKKHLSDMLSTGDETESTSRQLPKTLGRILSLPEYNFSPSSSHGKDTEDSFVNEQTKLSPRGNFHTVNEDTWQLPIHPCPSSEELESQSGILDHNPNEKVPSSNSYSDVSDELNHDDLVEENLSYTLDETSSEGVVESVNTTKTEHQQDSKVLEVLCEASSFLITREVQNYDTAEVCDEERSSQCLKLDSFEEDPSFSSPSVSPSSKTLDKKIEDPESTIVKAERPSPVSVLEPLCAEDDISPTSTTSRTVEKAIQPLQIHFDERLCPPNDQEICIRTCMEDEESAFEYVEAVLLGSGLNWEEYLSRWLSLNQLLDPSLFDEVELFSNRSHDQKLLFDCTNDVLKEVCERYFGCSFVKRRNVRPVPRGMKLIHEVWEGVEWHILQQPSPNSLDQLLRKDMVKKGTWMDIRFEAENIAIDLRTSILEELIEETILSL